MKAILLALLLLVSPAAAQTIYMGDNRGGEIETYQDWIALIQHNNIPVVIDGECASMCTVLALTLPRWQVCIMPTGTLGFHSAWYEDNRGIYHASPADTAQLIELYPPSVQEWIRPHLPLPISPLLVMDYETVIRLDAMRACSTGVSK